MAGHNLFGTAEAGFQSTGKCSPSRLGGLLHFRETKLARRNQHFPIRCTLRQIAAKSTTESLMVSDARVDGISILLGALARSAALDPAVKTYLCMELHKAKDMAVMHKNPALEAELNRWIDVLNC